MWKFPHHFKQGEKYIYVMYVYECNAILTTAKENMSDKEAIKTFKILTEDFKSRWIYPGFHFMDKEASNALNLTMATMNIKYQLVHPSNHRAKNTERAIHTFNNHFIAGMCSVDKYIHLKLWYRLLHQATISINLLRKSRTLTHILAYTHIFG